MANPSPPITTLGELQIYLAGEFALVRQAQDNSNADLKTLRLNLHELNNKVSPLIMLDVPAKIKDLAISIEKHDTELEKFDKYMAMQKAVLAAVGVAGAAIGSVATIVLEFLKVIHP